MVSSMYKFYSPPFFMLSSITSSYEKHILVRSSVLAIAKFPSPSSEGDVTALFNWSNSLLVSLPSAFYNFDAGWRRSVFTEIYAS